MRENPSLKQRFYAFLIKALLVCAALLLCAIVISGAFKRNDYTAAPTTPPVQATDMPILLMQPKATEAPAQSTAAPISTPAPTPEIFEQEYDYLPVYQAGRALNKSIAITVDDISQGNFLKALLELTATYEAGVTLFPSAQALADENICMMLRRGFNEQHYEIENRGAAYTPLYKLSDHALAASIWDVDSAINSALGVTYQCHFLRPYGGLGARDARTHSYLKQLGYMGVVTWSVNGSALSEDALLDTLAPGQIYLFDSTEKSMQKLTKLMQYAAAAGYRFITLNEMLGYEENECNDYDASYLFERMPALQETEFPVETLSSGDSSRAVYLMQQRLADLGYLDKADGVYGLGTTTAVAVFQVNCGLLGSGVCDPATQERLYADDAPRAGH